MLIQQMNAERQALRDQARGITPPDKLTKTQKKIWTYMKFHPDVTSYRAIARGRRGDEAYGGEVVQDNSENAK